MLLLERGALFCLSLLAVGNHLASLKCELYSGCTGGTTQPCRVQVHIGHPLPIALGLAHVTGSSPVRHLGKNYTSPGSAGALNTR